MARTQSAPLASQNAPSSADVYHRLLSATWTQLFIGVFAVFMFTNILFAVLYSLCGQGAVAGAETPLELFFFSVQTFSTIGYGTMAPVSTSAHVLVAIEAASGMIGAAIATGLVFTKFARPTSRVLYSAKAVVMPYDGFSTLCVRLANARNSEVVNATLQITALLNYTSKEGEHLRRFTDLPLISAKLPAFIYTWTAMHRIDAQSPLADFHSVEEMEAEGVRFFVSLTGIDGLSGRPLYSRTSYEPSALFFNHRFVDIVERRPNGQVNIAMEYFNEVEALKSVPAITA